MPIYLADASIWVSARNAPDSYLPQLLAERIADDEIATCVPVGLEMLVGPPTSIELEQDWQNIWQHVRWLPVDERAMSRAIELLRGLAATTAGAHRRRPIDYIVAACADLAGGDVVLWHFDRDLTAICDFVGIRHEPEHERARTHGITREPGEMP